MVYYKDLPLIRDNLYAGFLQKHLTYNGGIKLDVLDHRFKLCEWQIVVSTEIMVILDKISYKILLKLCSTLS